MSKYSTTLRYICETLAGLEESVGYDDIADVIDDACDELFDIEIKCDVPQTSFNMKTKYPALCAKILYHYYMREIAYETVGYWKLKLDSKLEEIMPYYDRLYEIAKEQSESEDLYADTDYKRVIDRDTGNNITGNNSNSSQSSSQNSGSNTQYDLYSDTPQGGLQGVEDGEYLTNATKQTGSNSGTASGTGSSTGNYSEGRIGTEDVTETVKGKRGGKSYFALMKEYRDTILNIDQMVIKELEGLFMLLW